MEGTSIILQTDQADGVSLSVLFLSFAIKTFDGVVKSPSSTDAELGEPFPTHHADRLMG